MISPPLVQNSGRYASGGHRMPPMRSQCRYLEASGVDKRSRSLVANGTPAAASVGLELGLGLSLGLSSGTDVAETAEGDGEFGTEWHGGGAWNELSAAIKGLAAFAGSVVLQAFMVRNHYLRQRVEVVVTFKGAIGEG
ncbi:hypothetical protein PanWU01x14_177540 [Parasponia andersonii]|uniref:Uncharacterized protein n=1 Tax=Parasponia andersonii TaxID=3476 RepID=A0A2P5C7Q3_PARAD|nr:hypothetical protein PanWU01x14_177540 [Parasponia andersonii]